MGKNLECQNMQSVGPNIFHMFTAAQKPEEEMRAQLRLGAGIMAQCVKELAVNLRLIPATRMLEERASSSL